MENLKVGMNGMTVNLKEFKVEKQETIKKWISKDNYNCFKRELKQCKEQFADIWFHGAKLAYEMNKDDIGVIIDCLMNAGGFCEQDEDMRYKFFLDDQLVYTIDTDII